VDPRFTGSLGGGASGAATGALIGSSIPGVGTGIGAAVGGGLGLGLGFLGGMEQKRAEDARRRAMDAAMKRLQILSRQRYEQRMGDLDKIMSFYGPIQNRLGELYGTGGGGLPPQGGMPPRMPGMGG